MPYDIYFFTYEKLHNYFDLLQSFVLLVFGPQQISNGILRNIFFYIN